MISKIPHPSLVEEMSVGKKCFGDISAGEVFGDKMSESKSGTWENSITIIREVAIELCSLSP